MLAAPPGTYQERLRPYAARPFEGSATAEAGSTCAPCRPPRAKAPRRRRFNTTDCCTAGLSLDAGPRPRHDARSDRTGVDEMTTAETLTLEGMLDAFGTAGRVLPRAALEQAAKRWPEVSAALLALLAADAAGTDRSDRTDRILFFGIYLMAQVCETRAFRTICTIAADGESMTRLIGDGVTEDLPCILARVYDGDQAPLRHLIEAPGAEQYARDAGVRALAWLTATGRIDRHETAQYLGELFTSLRPQAEGPVWVGWQHAIACLGLGELVPAVEEAFDRGWIDRHPANFQRVLLAAQQAAAPTAVFEWHLRNIGRLDDAADHLSHWAAFRPHEERRRPSEIVPQLRLNPSPVRNPVRDVGRNDPCPCGSGKKYKKCCLEKTG